MSNPLAAAQQTLAELHADTMREELRLRRMHGAGADNFFQARGRDIPRMGNDDLDG